MTRSLPTAKPIRQPGIENVFDIEVNSTATSFAPGTCNSDGGGLLEIDFRVSQVRQHQNFVLLSERDEVLIEIQRRYISGRICRITDDDRGRLRDRMLDRTFERGKEVWRRL